MSAAYSNKVALTAFLIATSFLVEISSQTIDFTIDPGDVTVSLNQMRNVTFRCSLSDPSLRHDWIVKFSDTKNLSTRDNNDMLVLTQRRVIYDPSIASVTIPGVLMNNGTLVSCTAYVFTTAMTEISDPVQLIIAGPPLSPAPRLVILCPSKLRVEWNAPYSNENFAVENYTVQIVNVSSGVIIDKETEISNTSHLLIHDGGCQAFSCHLLMVNVSAVSKAGESMPGTVSGGFPIAPQPLQSKVYIAVTFLKDGTPMAEVKFEAPFICDFQTSNYIITIEDLTNPGVPPLIRKSTYTGNRRMIAEIFDSGLQTNSNYSITTSVGDKHFQGNVSTTANFNTIFDPELHRPPDKGLGLEQIGAGVAGAMLVVLLLSITMITTALICTRSKCRTAPGATMDSILNNTTSKTDSDPLPRTENNRVYETINDYQTRMGANRSRMLSQQEQDYQWKLQQLELNSENRDEFEDSTYQVMNSASCGDVTNSHLSMSAPPLQYPITGPMQQSQHIANRSNSLTMTAQHCANEHDPPPTERTPDNTLPYGYHFRSYPSSSEAAVDVPFLSPVHEARSYSNNNPNCQVYTVNPQFGPVPLPNFTEDMNDMQGGEDSDELRDDDEEEQPYTFMSQAGTLSGLSSQGASCGFINCHDTGNQSVSTANVDKNGNPGVSDC